MTGGLAEPVQERKSRRIMRLGRCVGDVMNPAKNRERELLAEWQSAKIGGG